MAQCSAGTWHEVRWMVTAGSMGNAGTQHEQGAGPKECSHTLTNPCKRSRLDQIAGPWAWNSWCPSWPPA